MEGYTTEKKGKNTVVKLDGKVVGFVFEHPSYGFCYAFGKVRKLDESEMHCGIRTNLSHDLAVTKIVTNHP